MVLNTIKEADAGASETAFPRRSVGTINDKKSGGDKTSA